MNIVAVDIGNTKIAVGLFLDGQERSIEAAPGEAHDQVAALLKSAWSQVPPVMTAREPTRDGVIVVCSVKPAWTEQVAEIVRRDLGETIKLMGRDIPAPMPVMLDEPGQVGLDRLVAGAAAYAVVEGPVVVADFGTAVTIDLVDASGVFQGGAILPGFAMAAQALHEHTALLPQVGVMRPSEVPGKNTTDAIRLGLYYGAIGALEEIVRRYAERIGRWPQVVMTGSGAKIIYEDCPFVDNYVPNLVLKGLVLATVRHFDEQAGLPE